MSQRDGSNGDASAPEVLNSGAECGLALIVGAARSGTTLTRLLLDSHPEIGCPSEAGLPALMAHLVRVWSLVHADEAPDGVQADPGTQRPEGQATPRWDGGPERADEQPTPSAEACWKVPEAARSWVVESVRVPMTDYCARRGKRIYGDKSLDSVFHLGLVRDLFPDVRMVLVFRHVMDTVASGIEASPWGFNAYGYAPYVQASPGNAVAALAKYWLDHVDQALSWEQEHPEICHRVRYEDLVLQPEETLLGIERFLGVGEDLSALTAAFARDPARGPGDYKVEHTAGVHADSIGRGKRVPMTMLPPALLTALNEKLEALGYDLLDRGWNAAERPVDGRSTGFWADRLAQLMRAVEVTEPDNGLGSFAVVAEDHHRLRWVIEPELGTVCDGDGEVESVLIGTAQDLVLMLTGQENLGVLLRSGRIRHVLADEDEASRPDLAGELDRQVGLLRRSAGGSAQLADGRLAVG